MFFTNKLIINEVNRAPVLNFNMGTLVEAVEGEMVTLDVSAEDPDGLDVSLCAIDTEKRTLEYAGANNSIYIIRNENFDDNLTEKKPSLIEIKADRQPISIYINEKPFTNHIINLTQNDTIYLFSDGYADQFGGVKAKKFMTKRFKNLLVDINHKTLDEQKNILIQKHNDWKGNLKQIDDILVMGIKIDW